MDLEPVPDMPALIMTGRDSWAAVADLHIGIEVQMRKAGFSIPTQMPRMMRDLESLSKIARNLVLLGDLKHKIPAVGRKEDAEIRQLLGRMLEVFDRVVLISGNHDGGIASVLPEGCEGMGSKGWTVQDTGLFHGHVWPSDEVMRCEKIVMGHIHPSVLLKDSLGARNIEKCWLRTSLHEEATLERYDSCPMELVVIPAFNPLLTGTAVNSDPRASLGPIFRNSLADEESFRAYLLDGTFVGNPLKLRNPSER